MTQYMFSRAHSLGQDFSVLELLIFGADSSLWGEDCLVNCRIFISIPELYPLGNSSTSSVVTIKTVSRNCQMFPGDKIVPMEEPLV